MGHLHHAVHGWVTPAISYLVACLGALIALRSTRWALISEGRSRRNWLLFASVSLGGSIWSMHFVAMLGFAVSGAQIRYDVRLVPASLLVAVAFAAVGVFTVGRSRRPRGAVAVGGTATGLGTAAVHYLGMAAVRVPGRLDYDPAPVAASVVIAVLAATAALWAALRIRSTVAVLVAAPVMGLAICGMHYTGMTAVSVHLSPDADAPHGLMALQLVFPLAVGFGTYAFISALAFAVAPSRQRRSRPVPAAPAAPPAAERSAFEPVAAPRRPGPPAWAATAQAAPTAPPRR